MRILLHGNVEPVAAQQGCVVVNVFDCFCPCNRCMTDIGADPGPTGPFCRWIGLQGDVQGVPLDLAKVVSGFRFLGETQFGVHDGGGSHTGQTERTGQGD